MAERKAWSKGRYSDFVTITWEIYWNPTLCSYAFAWYTLQLCFCDKNGFSERLEQCTHSQTRNTIIIPRPPFVQKQIWNSSSCYGTYEPVLGQSLCFW